MRTRLMWFGLLVLVTLAADSAARADAAPEPGRPEWNETPLPMPADPPPELVIAMAALMAAGAFALASRVRA